MKPFDIVYLDMDGVLVDLVGALHKHFGLPDYPRSTTWNLELLPEGWEKEMQNLPAKFWADLSAFPWAHDLAHAARAIGERVVLLTVPCGPECAEGKAKWATYFGCEVEFCSGFQHKGEWAKGCRSLLIDDKEENCAAFIHAGGRALLWPAEHNHRYKEVADGIPAVLQSFQWFSSPVSPANIDTSAPQPSYLDGAEQASFLEAACPWEHSEDIHRIPFPPQAHTPVPPPQAHAPVPPPPAPEDHRATILQEALAIVTKDRCQAYGLPEDNFRNIAEIWTPILRQMGWEGPVLLPHQIAILMEAMKIARKIQNPTHKDSWVDTAGYAACGYRCAMTEET